MCENREPKPRRTSSTVRALFVLLLLALPGTAGAQWTTSGTNTTTSNNVGIGTTAPQSSLHVSTSSISPGSRGIIDEQTSNDGNGALLVLRKSRAGAAVQNGDFIGNVYSHAFDGTSFINSSRIRFLVDGTVTAGNVPTGMQFLTGTSAGLERMRITSAGNVGVGATTPGFLNGVDFTSNVPLHVKGTANQFIVVDGPSTGTGFAMNDSSQPVDNRLWSMSLMAGGGKLTFSTHTDAGTVSNKMVIDRLGNVGVGTSTPAAIVDGQRADATDLLMRLWNTSTGGGTATFRIANSSNAGSRLQFTDQTSYVSTIAAERTGGLRFRTGNASSEAALVDRMAILPSGNVGIGTNAPVTRLHVAGDITVDGNIAAKYQDVAEWVPSSQKLAAGMVVVLDTERSNHVLASTTSYDTRVAGVVSAQPGLSLGEAGEGKALVATTGRVKVRVDASRAPIRIGDLIVTSDVPGVAMKSEPVSVGGVSMHRPGTLIGKALESLEKGRGEILVLLSLQ